MELTFPNKTSATELKVQEILNRTEAGDVNTARAEAQNLPQDVRDKLNAIVQRKFGFKL